MDLQIKSTKKILRGFTLVEMLVVMGIVGVLATISTSIYSDFSKHENLELVTVGVVEAVRHAQSNAQVGKGDSVWGVAIFSDSAVIFKGESYVGRDASFDQSFDFLGGVVASGLSEIVFAKITGSTENVGSVTLTSTYGTKNIGINEKGTITY